jgi:hypothetical protein
MRLSMPGGGNSDSRFTRVGPLWVWGSELRFKLTALQELPHPADFNLRTSFFLMVNPTYVASCGPLFFDHQGRYYLIGNKLCAVREGCRDLAGEGIGWLRPGASLGPEG